MVQIPVQISRKTIQILEWTPAAPAMFLRNVPGVVLLIWNRGNLEATPIIRVQRPLITAPLAGLIAVADKVLNAPLGHSASIIGGEYNDANGYATLDLGGLGAAFADVFLAAIRSERL